MPTIGKSTPRQTNWSSVCQVAYGVYLRGETGAEPAVLLPAGHAAVVPRGRWHRMELDGPSDIMSVTFPRGSRLVEPRH